jgi:ABC-2 type transport system ATP-binding protein
METANAIEVTNLSKKFASFVAVNNISFSVTKGEIFGFLGANGAGKTTAIRMLTGLSKPSSGEASVAGFNVYNQSEKIKRNIGYMSQKFSLYEDLTIKENIQLFGGIYGIPRKKIRKKTDLLLEELGLADSAKSLVGSLPLGWRQKLAFSVAIFHDPAIVFLDEPTSGVDPITRRQFWEMIYKTADKGTTILVTTHYMDEAEYCDNISIMNHGIIEAIGTPNSLKEQYSSGSIEEVFVKIARKGS